MGRPLEIDRTLPEPPGEVWASLNRGRGERFEGAGPLEGLRGQLTREGPRQVVLLDQGGVLEIELLDAFGDTRLTLRGRGLPARLRSSLWRRMSTGRRRALSATTVASAGLAAALAGALALVAALAPDGPTVRDAAAPPPWVGSGEIVRLPVDGIVERIAGSGAGWIAVQRRGDDPLLVDLGALEAHALDVGPDRRVSWAPGGDLVLTSHEGVEVLSKGQLSSVTERAFDALAHPQGGWVLARGTELLWQRGDQVSVLVAWSGPIRPLGAAGDRVWFEARWAGDPQYGWVAPAGAVDLLPPGVRPRVPPAIGYDGAVWLDADAVVAPDGRRQGLKGQVTAPPTVSLDSRWVAWAEGDRLELWSDTGRRSTVVPHPGVPVERLSLARVGGADVMVWTDAALRTWAKPLPR